MRRVITGILCCLLVILLMSHNTFAVSPVLDTRLVRAKANTSLAWAGNDCDQPTNYVIRVASGKTACYMTSISFGAGYNEFLAGDIIEFDIFVIHNANDNALNNWVFATVPQVAESPSTGISIIGQELSTAGQNISKISYYLQVGNYLKTTNETRITLAFQWASMTMYTGDYMWANVSTWRVKTDDYSSITNSLDDVVEAIQDSAESSSEYQQAEQQAVENIENQTTDDTASELPDTSSATSLIGNIRNIFVQIGDIPAGNCTIPANWGNLNLGNLNLCTGKENLPFIVTFGAYAFELIFVIGASIILVKQVVNMFDWARGDN